MTNLIDSLEKYESLSAQEKALKREIDALKEDIKNQLESGYTELEDFVITLKEQQRENIDLKEFKKNCPKMFERYKKTTIYQTLRIKRR